jgi:hypothetical protein
MTNPAQVPESPKMLASMRRGVVQALRDHKAHGRSVIVWDPIAHEIVEVPPDEIILPETSLDPLIDE